MNLLKQNSFILGAVLALLSPVILYFSLHLVVDYLSALWTHNIPLLREHNILLISVFINLVIFYPYIHKPPYDKTGRGVLVVTFILTLIYFGWRYKQLAF